MSANSSQTFGIPEFVRKEPNGPLKVLVVGRISTEHQNIENIDASYAEVDRRLRAMYKGEMHVKRLGERGSGWNLKRHTIVEAEEEIQSGKWDVMIMEDLGRAYRNPQYQWRLAHMCKDTKTRLICLGDAIDTACPEWEPRLHTAVMIHGVQVPITRRRVRRTATYAFEHGGMVLKIRFGFRRLSKEEADSGEFGPKGLRIVTRPEFTPTIREMRERVLKGECYASIAAWLNDEGIAPGEYATRGVWTGQLVAELLRDPILHGLRTFRDVEYELVYMTGEHRRTPNEMPETQLIPELAHMTKEEQEELWAAMDKHAPKRGPHPRTGTARKMTFWPGQHLKCGICGAELYWYSRGALKCQNAYPGRPQTCWNHGQVDAELVRTKVLGQLLQVVRDNPELLEFLVDAVWKEFQRKLSRNTRRRSDVQAQIVKFEQDLRRITTLLMKRPESESLVQRLDETEQRLRELRSRLAELQQEADDEVLCASREKVLEHLDEVVLHLARTSYSFDLLMARSFPDFRLQPVQALDTPQVRPRIKLVVPPVSGGGDPIEIVIDAFEAPQHIRFARDCQRCHEDHPELTLQQIGTRLAIGKKAVCDALKFARLMEAHGTADAYVELTQRPSQASRWRQRSTPERQPEECASRQHVLDPAGDDCPSQTIPSGAA